MIDNRSQMSEQDWWLKTEAGEAGEWKELQAKRSDPAAWARLDFFVEQLCCSIVWIWYLRFEIWDLRLHYAAINYTAANYWAIFWCEMILVLTISQKWSVKILCEVFFRPNISQKKPTLARSLPATGLILAKILNSRTLPEKAVWRQRLTVTHFAFCQDWVSVKGWRIASWGCVWYKMWYN